MFYVPACVYAILPNQTNFGRKIRRNFMNFEEARRNPEKKMKIMSGRKVPFREQALPTIIYRIWWDHRNAIKIFGLNQTYANFFQNMLGTVWTSIWISHLCPGVFVSSCLYVGHFDSPCVWFEFVPDLMMMSQSSLRFLLLTTSSFHIRLTATFNSIRVRYAVQNNVENLTKTVRAPTLQLTESILITMNIYL